MKARIIEQPVKVYSERDDSSPAIAELAVGSEVELGFAKRVHGKNWVSVTLSTGQTGFIPGDARIFQIRDVILRQGSVNVYGVPSAQSAVISEYKKNAPFTIIDVVAQDNQDWVKIRDSAGNSGFIEGNTKVKFIPEKIKPTKAMGGKNMLYGALWCIGGIVVTALTYSSAVDKGGTYFIAWGAILFGIIQFLQGLYQYLRASE